MQMVKTISRQLRACLPEAGLDFMKNPIRPQCQNWVEAACCNNNVTFLLSSTPVRLCRTVYSLHFKEHTQELFRCPCQSTLPFLFAPFLIYASRISLTALPLISPTGLLFLLKMELPSPLHSCNPVLALIICVLQLSLLSTNDTSVL